MTIPNDVNYYLPGTIQIPSSLVITEITKAYPMVVTVIVNDVSEAETYIPGQLVKLFVPITYKMFQANGIQAKILSINNLDFALDVDSRQFDTFVVPASGQSQPASLSPAGSRNLEFSNTTGQVPFQSLNNRGN